jgi:hypothetical protein
MVNVNSVINVLVLGAALVSASAHGAVMNPIAITPESFEEDIIANAGQTALASTTAGIGEAVLFETGFNGRSDGLPVNGSFVSDLNSDISYQLQSYDANNVMMLTYASPSDSLVLQSAGKYSAVAVLGFSAFEDSNLTVILNFADDSSQQTSWSLIDWGNGGGAHTFPRLNYRTDDNSFSSGYSFYELEIAVDEINQSKLLESVTVSNSGFNNSWSSVSVFALSGTAVPEPASIALLGVVSVLGLFVRRRFLT